jgi:hypothetical protein
VIDNEEIPDCRVFGRLRYTFYFTQGGQNMLKNQQNADFLKNFFPSFSVFPS